MELKKERELRGISLKEIADSTKINLRFLRALEEDQLDILPGRFFIKGILRSYADYLGLEESAVLNKFYEEEQRRKEEKSDEPNDVDTSSSIPRSFKNKLYFTVTFIVLVALLASLYFIFHKDRNELSPIQSKPAPVLKEEEIKPPPATKIPVPAPEATEMKLSVTFHQDTWIQLYIDGELLLDGIKYPGDEFSATASREIIFNLGNAGGLRFAINDKAGRPLGRSGQVVKNIQITLDSWKDYTTEGEAADGE